MITDQEIPGEEPPTFCRQDDIIFDDNSSGDIDFEELPKKKKKKSNF